MNGHMCSISWLIIGNALNKGILKAQLRRFRILSLLEFKLIFNAYKFPCIFTIFYKYFPFSYTPYSFFIIFHLQLTFSHKYVKKHNSISISIFLPPFITQSQKNSNLWLKSNFNQTQKTTTNSSPFFSPLLA